MPDPLMSPDQVIATFDRLVKSDYWITEKDEFPICRYCEQPVTINRGNAYCKHDSSCEFWNHQAAFGSLSRHRSSGRYA